MMLAYSLASGRLSPHEKPLGKTNQVTWIDLISPSREEERAVEAACGIAVPTQEEMREIEDSSRLYLEDGAAYMTANIMATDDGGEFISAPISFILAGKRLITLRYHDPRFISAFGQRAQKSPVAGRGAESILISLLEAAVDRLADILEKAAHEIDAISREVFADSQSSTPHGRDYRAKLVQLGRKGDLLSIILDSIATLDRMFGFLASPACEREFDKEARARVKAMDRDTHSIAEHANAVMQKIFFVLDATLGLISIEQNGIINILSIVAVVFLPPTLVASIYGMNFKIMPELDWTYGYPVVLAVMAASAVLPYVFFKWKRWL